MEVSKQDSGVKQGMLEGEVLIRTFWFCTILF